MEQILAHLWGDYLLQSDKMALNKAKSKWMALFHAFTYTLPFFLFVNSFLALFVIFITHAIIDHYQFAKYVVYLKNKAHSLDLSWSLCRDTGYPNTTPKYLSVWLLIIADNTLHLTINYFSILYL